MKNLKISIVYRKKLTFSESDDWKEMCFVRFLAWNSLSAFTCLEDWCMGWWKIEMIVHNSDTHILLSWTWPKHERFFKYHYSNWKFTHTKGDTTLLSKNAHWSKQIRLIKEYGCLHTYYNILFFRNQTFKLLS